MSQKRKNEIAATVAALTVAAAIAATMTGVAHAAPPQSKAKKSTVTVRRAQKQSPIVVRMVGDRRAADLAAQQAYANLLAAEQARVEAQQQQASAVSASTYNGAPVSGSSSVVLDANGNPIPVTSIPIGPSTGNYSTPIAPGFNVVASPYGAFGGPVQTITIPGNGFAGLPTLNTYGGYPNGGFTTGGLPVNGYTGYGSGYGGYGVGGYYGSNAPAVTYPSFNGGYPGNGVFFRF